VKNLPPGQKASNIFPRFGLPQYANRFPTEVDVIRLSILGDVEEFEISKEIDGLDRVDQVSDFHCVTTWSKQGLNWSGYGFRDFYNTFILPKVSGEITCVVIKAQDGYKTSLPLSDLMQENVLLADRLDGKPLDIEHGAPIRIVAPDHYGYKNVKHVKSMGFYAQEQKVKQGILGFMDHPRARVAYEERASNGPGRLFRWLYKFGVKGTIKNYEKATAEYKARIVKSH